MLQQLDLPGRVIGDAEIKYFPRISPRTMSETGKCVFGDVIVLMCPFWTQTDTNRRSAATFVPYLS